MSVFFLHDLVTTYSLKNQYGPIHTIPDGPTYLVNKRFLIGGKACLSLPQQELRA
jgi:hypothetical protein